MVMIVIVGGELFTDYSDHPSQTCHAKPKLKSTGADATSFFRWWDALPQAVYLKDFSPASGRCGIAQQIKERRRFTYD